MATSKKKSTGNTSASRRKKAPVKRAPAKPKKSTNEADAIIQCARMIQNGYKQKYIETEIQKSFTLKDLNFIFKAAHRYILDDKICDQVAHFAEYFKNLDTLLAAAYADGSPKAREEARKILKDKHEAFQEFQTILLFS